MNTPIQPTSDCYCAGPLPCPCSPCTDECCMCEDCQCNVVLVSTQYYESLSIMLLPPHMVAAPSAN